MSGTIELLGEQIPVAAQPWNRLASGLAKYRDRLTPDTDVTVAMLGAEAYEVLCVLAPEVGRRIPKYRWHGFESKEQQDESPSDFGMLDGPTVPELVEAFRVAFKTNGTDVLGGLSKIVDPTLIKALLTGAIEDAARSYSATSRSQNGVQASTSGTASRPPLGSMSEGSRFPASKPSSPAGG